MFKNGVAELVFKTKKGLKKFGAEISGEKQIANGVQFFVKSSCGSGYVRIYSNKKKGVRIDCSQLDSEELAQAVKDIGNGVDPETNQKTPAIEYPLVGCDESGKGDLFGPLVCAAVFASEETSKKLAMMGARDSKLNTDKKNICLAGELNSFLGSKCETLILVPAKYNEIYAEYSRKSKTLNDVLCCCHEKTIGNLAKRHVPKSIIVDKFSSGCSFNKSFAGKTRFFFRAENIPPVAAASILARAAFLGEIEKMSCKYGVKIPLGSSDAALETAVKIAEKYGVMELQKAVKMNFRTAQKALKSAASTNKLFSE